MGIARRWSLRAWIAVFAFGLWNRETALLVPLWLLIDGALVAGASLAAAGGAFVFWIRATLFRHRLDVTVDPLDTSHSGLSNHLMLWRNAREFWTELPSLGRGPTGRARLITASVIAGCVIALMLATRLTSDGKKALVWSLAALATVVTFGAIGEARIWIGFIPIILFWIAVFAGHARSLRFLRSLG
jgi:hypothetical protein